MIIPSFSYHKKRSNLQNSESKASKDSVSIHSNTTINIIEPNKEKDSFRVSCDKLEKILCKEEFIDKKVCVIGIAGKFRKGKSFMLNFFLQYLTHITTNKDHSPQNWHEDNKSSSGFMWRGGSESHTIGICFWSEPFVVQDKNGEDLVILLMDTEGTFNQGNTLKTCTTIFALSTIISSVQIYNLQNNIHEDDLDYLQYFVEYGRMVLGDNINPFQSLVFLVRDWSSPNEYKWGFNGGEDFLTTRLKSTDDQSDDRNSIRIGIQNSFKDIKCFLMPHPGNKVAENSADFEGQVSAIREEFRDYLEIFVSFILNRERLLPKEINGNPATCRQLIKQIKEYAEIFNNNKLPDPKSLFHVMVKITNETACENAYITYLESMKKKYKGNAFMLAFNLNKYHSEIQDESLRVFKEFKKMGGANYEKDYLKKLKKDIKKANDEIFNHRKLLTPMAIRSIPIAGTTVALGTIALGITGPVGVAGAAIAGTLFLVGNFVKPIEEQDIPKKI